VEASVSDGGTLSYQWYVNEEDSNHGGTKIDGATGDSYTVPTEQPGTFYYYVEITNTNDQLPFTKAASVKSNPAEVTVLPWVDAAVPVIDAQPTGATVVQGARS